MATFRRIIVVGLNAAIDRTVEVPQLRPGAHLRGRRLSVQPAGKGVNVARTLGVLGRDCLLTGFVGGPELEWYTRSLRGDCGERVDVRLIGVDGHTRQSTTVIDASTGADTHLVEQSYDVTDRDRDAFIETLDTTIGAVGAGALVCFCGSLPTGVSVDWFTGVLRRCVDRGARVAVDTSGASLAAAATLPLWMIKPNVEELSELTGVELDSGDADGVRAAASGLAQTIEHVAVSAGGDGACLVTRGGAWRGRTDFGDRRVVNTVGAGDSFFAGFVDGWQRDGDARAALRGALSVSAARVTSMTHGALRRETIDALAAETVIESL